LNTPEQSSMSPHARRFHLRKSEVIAVLTHALSGATNCPPNTIFCPAIFDLSHRALQARGMRLSTPNFIGIQARLARLRRLWARFFEHGDVVLLPVRPTGTHPARSKSRSACAINCGQWQTKAAF
jgi:hypothetical protein